MRRQLSGLIQARIKCKVKSKSKHTDKSSVRTKTNYTVSNRLEMITDKQTEFLMTDSIPAAYIRDG